MIHRLLRAARIAVPPLRRWNRLIHFAKKRFPATDEDIEIALDANLKMKINLVDFVSYHIYARGYYEEDTVRAIQSILEPGMTFFDIGAHFGQYTLIGAAAVRPAGTVHAFEPGPEQMSYLKHNVALNQLDNVVLNQIALGDRIGEIEFSIGPKVNLGSSRIGATWDKTIKVEMTTLDAYCDTHDLSKIDVVKLDVEGAEMLVLEGARKTFASVPPKAVFYECIDSLCEQYGFRASDVHDFFRSEGYALMRATRRGIEPITWPPPDDQEDFVAIRV